MVATLAPFAIFAGVAAVAALIFWSFWGSLHKRATKRVSSLSDQLERAGIKQKPEELVAFTVAGGALLWILTLVVLRPSILVGAVLAPVFLGIAAGGFYLYVYITLKKRIDLFTEQLELALRLLASGIRVGLGMRQAFNIVMEEMPDPMRHEFARVIGQTNIGVAALDAIDEMARRMPSNESQMMARAVRVQSQTGGDLAKVLETLANTIKDRRQIQRKIGALTAEGRMSAVVLMVLPLGLGAFIWIDQPDMGRAVFTTALGHYVLITMAVLNVLGVLWLRQILQVKV